MLLSGGLGSGSPFFRPDFEVMISYIASSRCAKWETVAFMAFSIQKGLENGSVAFAIGYVSFRVLLIVQYVRAGVSIVEARKMAYGYAIGFMIAALIWVASCFVPPPFRYILWLLAIAIDLSTPSFFRKEAMKFPPNLVHIPERFGLFTIIVLGEAVVAGITAIKSVHLEFSQYVTAGLSLILAFALWWDYFDIVKGAEIDEEALKDGAKKFRAWMYLHLPLTATIGILAAGLSVAMLLPVDRQLTWDQGWIISGGAGLCMFLLGFTWLASPELTGGRTPMQQSLPYIVIATIGLFAGGLVHSVPTPAFIFIFIVLIGLRIARGIRDGALAEEVADNEEGPSSLSIE